jgi:hypothetical protein
MKTAVEWLIEELRNKHGMPIDLYSEFQQAKEMEKEQIIEAHTIGYIIGGGNGDLYNPKEYYNETFKQQE